eukprot:m.16802 g.16802  ORF g.16802 m.16802 type:complete len:358 (-) comp7727_c0_seq1:1786-2859(-)
MAMDGPASCWWNNKQIVEQQHHLLGLPVSPASMELMKLIQDYPVETAVLTTAPAVPPPIARQHPVRLIVEMNTTAEMKQISLNHSYPMWTFNGSVPGPFIRARVGDVLEVRYTNKDKDGIAHNIDFHAVTGPGGGAPCLLAEQNETKTGIFQMMQPGLFVYHCAAGPVPQHVQNGMYGLMLVEPREGLPKVDREFYVMQSEWYATAETGSRELEPSWVDGMIEHPLYVTFNGSVGALTEKPICVKAGERIRLFVGNGGPNLVSSFHVIGAIFDKVYREGDVISPPARGLQTTLIPAGGASIVEWDTSVPGNYTMIDHSIFRIEKGAIGFIKVQGEARPDIYDSVDRPTPCIGCKLHN